MRCSNSLCTGCNGEVLGVACVKCKEQKYCGNSCRVQDWNRHYPGCEVIRNNKIKQVEINCPFIKVGRFLSELEAEHLVSIEKEIETKYEIIKGRMSLGKGAYGKVILVKDRKTNNELAMKVIEKEGTADPSTYKALLNEVDIHKRLIHENIIRIISYAEDVKRLYIIMEYGSKGSLFRLLRSKGKFTEKEAFFFFIQTCSAIHFLHSHKVMHRDIKPENLLVTKEGVLKLCDFGCCTRYRSKTKVDFCGTTEYMAPEILRREAYDEKIDIWSLGILLYEMLHGYTPYKGRSNIRQTPKLLFDKIPEDVKELIEMLLDNVADKRPEVWEIFLHPWVGRMQEKFGIRHRSNLLCDYESLKTKCTKRPIARSLLYQHTGNTNELITSPELNLKRPHGDSVSSVTIEFKNNNIKSAVSAVDTTGKSTHKEPVSSNCLKEVGANDNLEVKQSNRRNNNLRLGHRKCISTIERKREKSNLFSACGEEGTALVVKASGYRVSINRINKDQQIKKRNPEIDTIESKLFARLGKMNKGNRAE